MTQPKLAQIEEFPELKFSCKKENNYTFVLQYPPQIRSIIVNGVGKNYRLAFPYLTFIINLRGRQYDKTVLGLTNKPLESVEDKIYRVPLSNIYREPEGMGLCMSLNSKEFNVKASIKNRLRSVVDQFWFTQFGGTATYRGSENLDDRVINYQTWEAQTKEDPSFATTVAWNDPNFTLKELMSLITKAGFHGGGFQSNPHYNPQYNHNSHYWDSWNDDKVKVRNNELKWWETELDIGLVDLFNKPYDGHGVFKPHNTLLEQLLSDDEVEVIDEDEIETDPITDEELENFNNLDS